MSITKLSPNWACQMGPIHCPKFLLPGLPFLPHPLPYAHVLLLRSDSIGPTPYLCPILSISRQLPISWPSPPSSNTHPISLYFNPLIQATPILPSSSPLYSH